MYDIYDNDFDKAFDEAVDALGKKEHRLIDADKLKAHYAWWAEAGDPDMKDAFDTIVNLQPTVDPIKHGRWLASKDGHGCECSECGAAYRWSEADTMRYCKMCGARMDAQIGEDKSHPFAESVMMGMDEVENDKGRSNKDTVKP